ncbi:chorismate-binding protein, partial [Escherichia coli]|uniref:chorismate-binding protein n=1 Tax=Escherichia coli TaxID=562 RepID=UPI00139CD82D|nr:anthranilate synthase component I [Escherichia coli]
ENVPAHPAARPEDRRFSFLFCRTIVAISHREHHVHIFSHAVLNGNESEREKKEIYDKAISEMNRVVKRIYRFSVQEEPKKIGGAATANHIDFSTVRSNYTKEKFIRDVQKIKNYIARGDIFQAVLSQRFSRPVRANGLDIYRVLRVMN